MVCGRVLAERDESSSEYLEDTTVAVKIPAQDRVLRQVWKAGTAMYVIKLSKCSFVPLSQRVAAFNFGHARTDWIGARGTQRRPRFVTNIRKVFHLNEHLSTPLARRVTAAPGVPATNALEVPVTPALVLARPAVGHRPNGRVWRVVSVPSTPATGASQIRIRKLSFPFLQVESLPQPKFQGVPTVGEGFAGDISDVFFHELHRFWVFGVRHQQIALHLHDLVMTS